MSSIASIHDAFNDETTRRRSTANRLLHQSLTTGC